MLDFLWKLAGLYDYITIFITWSFVIAFLYNLSASINKYDKSCTQLAFIMMVSYTSSVFMDPLSETPHLTLFIFDIVTIFVLILWRIYFSKNFPVAFYYLLVGLSFNAFVFFGMHYDSIVLGNLDYWWFWALYAIGQIISDLTMLLILLINKDFLGLVALKRHLLNPKKCSNEEVK
ncbi:hypothetical protein [Pseudoalteromonas sp. Z9A5]|uniref:hypothetical protein n=1 Tax=Pseudoalteromonas sp. Z9A5 TaxID=2686355 RepID=UPI0014084958|nr:hypothetical protein [Pseudoalteromonas sp. Z9A5]